MESEKKTLEHRELMETVFIGASATGKHHWTPRKKVVEAADVSSNSMDSIGAQPFVDPIPARAKDFRLTLKGSGLRHQVVESRRKQQVAHQL
ncbi:hypothetical protein CsSME_00000123 [Camellia sinensis var. sinensis]